MKLRNKKTGEMAVFSEGIIDLNQIGCKNVAEMLDAGWQDYEEPKSDIIDFSNVRLPVVEIHRKVRDCSNHKAELIISLDQKTGALTYRVVNKELGYDFVYTPLEFSYVAWTIIGEDKK